MKLSLHSLCLVFQSPGSHSRPCPGQGSVLFTLTLTLACVSTEPDSPPPTQTVHEPTPLSTKVSSAQLGQTITLVGRAINRKGGATLVAEGFEVWMADFDSWPDCYYQHGEEGELLTVTGVLGEDHGLPVFVPSPDEPIVQGIPVPEGTDLDQASHRFLLSQAQWTPKLTCK